MKIIDHLKKSVYPLISYLYYGTSIPMLKMTDEQIIRVNMRRYKRLMGYQFDIHNPHTFTEKVQWYKFFYSHPNMHAITDKVRFKQFIYSKLGGVRQSRYMVIGIT